MREARRVRIACGLLLLLSLLKMLGMLINDRLWRVGCRYSVGGRVDCRSGNGDCCEHAIEADLKVDATAVVEESFLVDMSLFPWCFNVQCLKNG